MRRVLVFGGTTEGRLLCDKLAALPVQATACVATAYGAEMLSGIGGAILVKVGRMDRQAMADEMRQGYGCVIDATHPYAQAASQTILAAAADAGIPVHRLLRPQNDARGARSVASLAEAVALLSQTEGNILAATGAKELDAYAALADFPVRVYARVLPTEASIARCAALGLPGSHIIAMQGPFSQALNEALICQLEIRWLVTKESGDLGGFMAKMDAAAACGIQAIVIGRPPEGAGHTMEAILRLIMDDGQ